MEQRTRWVVNNPSTPKKKMPFLNQIKITDEMNEESKKFFTNYNNMQKELIKNGLMESK